LLRGCREKPDSNSSPLEELRPTHQWERDLILLKTPYRFRKPSVMDINRINAERKENILEFFNDIKN
jgi:hypothetical protein